jgi:hypothetical protein
MMEFPEREVALAWVGRTLVDREGAEIGACTAVFTDDATRVTEWVCSEYNGTAVFIPAVGATESGDQVQVAVSRNDVANAPAVGGTERISDDEEEELYRHYGIPHSRDASPSLLPTGEQEPDADQGPFDTTTAREPATAGGDLEPRADSGDTGNGRSRVLPVVGGLASVGMAVGAVLGVRRLRRRRPPTRTERILARGRAASGAVSRGAGRLTATTGRVGRRPGRAGAVALPLAAAITLPALRRRRRSGTDPNAD